MWTTPALHQAPRTKAATCLDKIDESEYGIFAWVMDPEGNKVELVAAASRAVASAAMMSGLTYTFDPAAFDALPFTHFCQHVLVAQCAARCGVTEPSPGHRASVCAR